MTSEQQAEAGAAPALAAARGGEVRRAAREGLVCAVAWAIRAGDLVSAAARASAGALSGLGSRALERARQVTRKLRAATRPNAPAARADAAQRGACEAEIGAALEAAAANAQRDGGDP